VTRRGAAEILDAAGVCLQRDPGASVADVAAAAGVGRMTLYGHFRSRDELVARVFEQTMARADVVLDDVDLLGNAAEAHARLVGTAWQIVEQYGGILHAGQRALPAERVRAAHERVIKRLAELIERGRDEGVFRQDLPAQWLGTVALSLVHAAADEVRAGRLDGGDAGWHLVTTLLGALAPPTGGGHADAPPAGPRVAGRGPTGGS
jgi:TetR/AcrR family transcriptional regulator, mexCD-oprJ operon repressor